MKESAIINRINEIDALLERLKAEQSLLTKQASNAAMKKALIFPNNKDFTTKYNKKLKQIPTSTGCKYYKKLDINIGIVADEFLYNSFKDTANLIYITPDNYLDFTENLDIFFVVSTWKGLNNEWLGLGSNNLQNPTKLKLYNIIKHYKENGIKTVFYSKEDPPNYSFFVDAAKKCDFIFTTASEKINEYKIDCDNENVFLLGFAFNPVYNNPIGCREYKIKDSILFAGSWYRKYNERCVVMQSIFDSIMKTNYQLTIIDRNYNLKNIKYKYPEKYNDDIYPAIDHGKLQKLHKLYNYAINFTSVIDSESMMPNRIYEMLAQGNLVISNYAVSINNVFPNIFLQTDTINEIERIFSQYSDDEAYIMQMHGLREAMNKHNAFVRIKEMLDKIGFGQVNQNHKKVAVLCNHLKDDILADYQSQTYPYKQIFDVNKVESALLDDFDFICFFNSEYKYEEFYLEDMINAFKYTNCDFVTKDSYLEGKTKIKGIEHNYIDTVKDKYKTVYYKNNFNIKELISESGETTIKNGYAVDCLEFNTKRIIFDKSITKKKLSVIVPVYNNGNHLLGKCFASLQRSSMFKDMEIILIDDGSTDDYTTMLVKRLGRKYENIITYTFDDGGSGSASRPRNKGLEIASADYVTYLDPDNEAINDGYTKLYKSIIDSCVDLAIGGMIKLTEKSYDFKYATCGIIKNPKGNLIKNKFPSQSVQAMIINKKYLIDSNIDMVEGAIGEDTLFFYELMATCKKALVIDEPIHIYYAAVEGSSVNSVHRKFFQKYFLLEKEKMRRLKEHGVLDIYLDTRYEKYFIGWYLAKLKKVDLNDIKECVDSLLDIYKLYNSTNGFTFSDTSAKKFIDLAAMKKYDSIVQNYILS